MKKEVGVIMSVLKPVDDTRMYEKMAQSLVGTGKFSVNIIGFYSNTHTASSDISFYPIFNFKAQQLIRLLANFQVFRLMLRIKPNFIIVTTPELAPAVLLYKSISRVRLFYDTRENHSRNIVYHHQKQKRARKWLARLIDKLEQQLAQKSGCLLVAEQGYYQEKPWLANFSAVLLENKVIPLTQPLARKVKQENLCLLYSGTISDVYGIWEALSLAKQLYQALRNRMVFRLIGHVTQLATYHKLQAIASDNPWILSTISLSPVPHRQLLEAMQESDFGMVCHRILPSIENCFPTRIWEYMNYELPFFLQDHSPWVEYCQPWQCAVPINFSQSDWPIEKVVEKVERTRFYPRGKPLDIYWEGHKFISVIDKSS
ncbi:MAG: hypothetical protein AAF632_03835 [Bacteroidota bacterium]